MINYEKLEHKLNNCYMNNLLKDKRINKYLEYHKKDICPHAIKINDNYKCKKSIEILILNHNWND